ncbi:hypothetical protein [Pseudomonas sp. USHLN015]|uniref:hypothetical protein n=1 Tax=Pseudomonas sp. USHLN015 TaxID=3081296 RepID=UPI00301B75A4
MHQQNYWVELQSLKAHVIYLELYQLRSESYERWISIFLAVTSSASIGGWALWKEYSMVWGAIIVASQVLSVVYKFLPFKSRIKPLSKTALELSELSDEAEKAWFDVASGELTDKEINEKRFEIRASKAKILRISLEGMVLPEIPKMMRKAEQQMCLYFNSYLVEETNE